MLPYACFADNPLYDVQMWQEHLKTYAVRFVVGSKSLFEVVIVRKPN